MNFTTLLTVLVLVFYFSRQYFLEQLWKGFISNLWKGVIEVCRVWSCVFFSIKRWKALESRQKVSRSWNKYFERLQKRIRRERQILRLFYIIKFVKSVSLYTRRCAFFEMNDFQSQTKTCIHIGIPTHIHGFRISTLRYRGGVLLIPMFKTFSQLINKTCPKSCKCSDSISTTCVACLFVFALICFSCTRSIKRVTSHCCYRHNYNAISNLITNNNTV